MIVLDFDLLRCLAPEFFKDLFTLSYEYWSEIGKFIYFGHCETSGTKTSCFAAWTFFPIIYELESDNGVWTKIRVVACGFCLFAAIYILCFFFNFWSDFFLSDFSIHLFSNRGRKFCLVNDHSLNCVRDFPAMALLFLFDSFFKKFRRRIKLFSSWVYKRWGSWEAMIFDVVKKHLL